MSVPSIAMSVTSRRELSTNASLQEAQKMSDVSGGRRRKLTDLDQELELSMCLSRACARFCLGS